MLSVLTEHVPSAEASPASLSFSDSLPSPALVPQEGLFGGDFGVRNPAPLVFSSSAWGFSDSTWGGDFDLYPFQTSASLVTEMMLIAEIIKPKSTTRRIRINRKISKTMQVKMDIHCTLSSKLR